MRKGLLATTPKRLNQAKFGVLPVEMINVVVMLSQRELSCFSPPSFKCIQLLACT